MWICAFVSDLQVAFTTDPKESRSSPYCTGGATHLMVGHREGGRGGGGAGECGWAGRQAGSQASYRHEEASMRFTD